MNNMGRLFDGVSVELFALSATALLAVGLVMSVALRKHPARAHRALLLSMAMCLLLAPMMMGVNALGWGLLPAERNSSETTGERVRADSEERPQASFGMPPREEGVPEEGVLDAGAPEVRAPRSDSLGRVQREGVSRESGHMAIQEHPKTSLRVAPMKGTSESATVGEDVARLGISQAYASFRAPFLWVWLALAALAVVRFIVSLTRGAVLLQRARPCHDVAVQQAVDAAAEALQLQRAPTVFVSTAIRTPVIWAWRLHPALLLPEALAAQAGTDDWRGILCHELAHVKRRDHWAALVSELLLCALPWHPLAWAAKRRLAHLSELACDDWALACGQDGPRYAESLVNLAPQRRPILAPSAATSRSGLKDRVQRVLNGRPSDPRLCAVWSGGLVVLFAALTVVAAMTQSCAPETTPSTAETDLAHKPQSGKEGETVAVDTRPGEQAVSVDADDDDRAAAAPAVAEEKGKPSRSSYLDALAKGLREGGEAGGPSFDDIVRYHSRDDVLKVVLDDWQDIPNGSNAPAKRGVLRGFFQARHQKETQFVFDFSPLPGALAVLHLGATDKQYEVRRLAFEYLSVIAFRNLKPGAEYEAWYAKYRDMPMEEVLLGNSADVVSRLRKADAFQTEELTHILSLASDYIPVLRDVPAVREHLKRDGILDVFAGLIHNAETPRVMIGYVFGCLDAIEPDDTFLADVAYPLYKDENTSRDIRERCKWLLYDYDRWKCKLNLEDYAFALALAPGEQATGEAGKDGSGRPLPLERGGKRDHAVKEALGRIGEYADPVVIPQLIGALDLDVAQEFDSVQRIGKVLQPLTNVPVDPTHDAAWWRRWWEENRSRFDPEIAAMEIPKFDVAGQ